MSQQTSRLRKWIQRCKRRVTPLYYEIVYGVCAPKHVTCMNYGYAPVTEANRPHFPEPSEGLQYELYWQTFSQLQQPLEEEQLLCEISCGRGGGLAFLRYFTASRLLGLERSSFARRHARRFGLDVRLATAPTLPLEDESVDVFFSIEAAHNYHSDAFVSELARCLKPGGRVLMADMNLGADANVRNSISQRYARHGMIVQRWRDIRPNVLESLRLDEERKQLFLHTIPTLFRPEAVAYMGMVGSHKHLEMQQDERAYFIMLAEKLLRKSGST